METKDLKQGSFYIIKSNKTGAELYVKYLGDNKVCREGFTFTLSNYTVLKEESNEAFEKQAQIIELVKLNKDKIVFKKKITLYKENYVAIQYNESEDEYFLRGENFLVNKRFLDIEEIDDLDLIFRILTMIKCDICCSEIKPKDYKETDTNGDVLCSLCSHHKEEMLDYIKNNASYCDLVELTKLLKQIEKEYYEAKENK